MNDSKFFRFSVTLFELTKWAIVIVVFLLIFLLLVGKPLLVNGGSMLPNFHSGEIVIVEQISYLNSKPIKRGDVVAAKFPADEKKTRLIKRVIGLPGEIVKVKDTHFFINDAPLTENYQPIYGQSPYKELAEVRLDDDEYFLSGDNRPGSSDSRLWGPVTRQDILGRVAFVAFPPSQLRFIGREE